MNSDLPQRPAPNPFNLVMINAGLLSTALTLGLNFVFYSYTSFNFMGWLIVGPLILGLLSGLGYLFIAQTRGIRPTVPTLIFIACAQTACFVAIALIEYAVAMPLYPNGASVDFLTWYDTTTRSMTISSSGSSRRFASPLGAWGYGVRLLDLMAFVGVTVGILHSQSRSPYCESCKKYLDEHLLALLASGVVQRRTLLQSTKRSLTEASQNHAIAQAVSNVLNNAFAAAESGDAATVQSILSSHAVSQKESQKLTSFVNVTLHACPECHSGYILATEVFNQSNQTKPMPIARIDVKPDVAAALRQVVAD